MANNSELDFSVVLIQQDAGNVQLEFAPKKSGGDDGGTGVLPASTDLNFQSTKIGDPHLNFGTGVGETIKPVSFTAVIADGGVRFDLRIEITKPAPISFVGHIPAPELASIKPGQKIFYDNRMYRPFGPQVRDPWELGVSARADKLFLHETTLPYPSFKREPWSPAVYLPAFASVGFGVLSQFPISKKPIWEEAKPLGTGTTQPFTDLSPAPFSRDSVWEEAVGISDQSTSVFEQGIPRRRESETKWQEAKTLSRVYDYRHAVATLLAKGWVLPWELGRLPPPGKEDEIIVPPEPGEDPFVGDPDLNFECPLLAWPALKVLLNFGQKGCPVIPTEPEPEPEPGFIIPTRRYYYVLNDIICTRLDSGDEIQLLSCDISIDWKSWAWGLSATVAAKHFEKIEPSSAGPVAIKVMVNGYEFRFLIESYDDKQAFANRDVNFSGRSLTAYLDTPYAPTRSYVQTDATTSRQLADNELARAGLVTGYTLDWKIVDALGWAIPANTWDYTNLSPVAAIKEIVTGVGGYLNSHPWKKELQARSAYPSTPWEWASAQSDILLPRSIIMNQSLSWEEKPLYNGIYVSGERTGVTAFGRRDGTAGDDQAPMVTDAMITDTAAARERIRAELSAGGKQAAVSVELPLTEYAPLFLPGYLTEVDESFISKPNWKGLARSVKVSGRWSETLEVTQTVELERHY